MENGPELCVPLDGVHGVPELPRDVLGGTRLEGDVQERARIPPG